ncbi:MAG: hypothetical protein ACLT16_07060 [[Clostridium] innocuum]
MQERHRIHGALALLGKLCGKLLGLFGYLYLLTIPVIAQKAESS